MSKPALIIVTGPPGVGKTHLSCKLAERLKLYCLHRDDLKEILYDAFGFGDMGWSKKLGAVSFAILNFLMEDLMSCNITFMVEANFQAKYEDEPIKELKRKYNYNIIQIYCTASDKILFERYTNRYERSHLHMIHFYHYNSLEQFRENMLKGQQFKLAIPKKTIVVKTDDFEKINYNSIIKKINQLRFQQL